jgi:hypothetical protein
MAYITLTKLEEPYSSFLGDSNGNNNDFDIGLSSNNARS